MRFSTEEERVEAVSMTVVEAGNFAHGVMKKERNDTILFWMQTIRVG